MTYVPHVWSRHDKLDSAALNNLEQAVGAVTANADEVIAAAANANTAAANAAASAQSASASATTAAAEIDAQGLLQKTDPRIPQTVAASTYGRAFVDSAGRVVLGLKTDGTVEAPVLKTASINGTTHDAADGLTSGDGTSYQRVYTDQAGRLIVGIRSDGSVVIPALSGTLSDPTNGAPIPAASGPDIICIGDSLTAYGYPDNLQTLAPAVHVTNGGVGGETSVGIAARQGGQPYTLAPTGGTIPASGPVNVTISTASGDPSWPMLQGPTSYTGTLAGIKGTFAIVPDPAKAPGDTSHSAADTYTFTRTTAGAATALTQPGPFYFDTYEAHRSDIAVIWIGRNNYTQGDQIMGDLEAIIGHLTAANLRWLVLSVPNGEYPTEFKGGASYATILALNNRLRLRAGRRFLDIRSYLVEYGLTDAGITPTSQDTTDVGNDVPPTSLRADSIHPNATGRQLIAQQVYNRLNELGWIRK